MAEISTLDFGRKMTIFGRKSAKMQYLALPNQEFCVNLLKSTQKLRVFLTFSAKSPVWHDSCMYIIRGGSLSLRMVPEYH